MWDHIRGAIFFFFFRARRGNRTPRSLFHEVGDNEHYGYWRWPVSSCIRHTHYQISTTVQIFLFSQKHSQTIGSTTSARFWSHMMENADGKVQQYLSRRWHRNLTCLCIFMYILPIRPACCRGHANSGHCVTWMEEVYGGTVAQTKEKKKKTKRGPTSTLPHMATLDVGTVFTVTFLEDKVELKNTSSLSHISLRQTLRHLNVCLLKET